MSWKLTERIGPKVTKSSYADVSSAIEALEARGRELAKSAPDQVVDVKITRFEPREQVIARLELAGPQRFVPSVHAGIDVHGDGSVEAYRGRVKREEIEELDGESAYAALRRVLGQG